MKLRLCSSTSRAHYFSFLLLPLKTMDFLLLLRSQGASLFPGLLRITASVTLEAVEAAEACAKEAADRAAAALDSSEVPSLLPPLKSPAAVAAAALNASQLLSGVAVAVPVGSTELLVFAHKVTERREARQIQVFSCPQPLTSSSSSFFLLRSSFRRKRPKSTRPCSPRGKHCSTWPSGPSRTRSRRPRSPRSSSRSSRRPRLLRQQLRQAGLP